MENGSSTSEFKLTVVAQIAGAVLEAVAMVLHQIQDVGLGGQIVVVALLVCGVLLQIATLLGYQKARSTVKSAKELANVAVRVDQIGGVPVKDLANPQ